MMEPLNFCYWLQGYFELAKTNELSQEQVLEIKRHLDIVFNKPIKYNGPMPSIYPLEAHGYTTPGLANPLNDVTNLEDYLHKHGWSETCNTPYWVHPVLANKDSLGVPILEAYQRQKEADRITVTFPTIPMSC